MDVLQTKASTGSVSSPCRENFRPDINGMRAIAVLGVISFHFKLGILRAGGFAGVDVFFVISGFLMTQIISGRLDRGRFTFSDFVNARARRIVPALVVLVSVVLAVGVLLLNPIGASALAERAFSSLLFVSNILYATQGAYFDIPEQNWLLHTWSLSVEWQFYLLFPILLALLRRLTARRRWDIAAFAVVALGSFVFMVESLSWGGRSPVFDFYMLPSRAWEFLVGALVAIALPSVSLPPRPAALLHYAGMAAVFLTMMVVHNHVTPWPSFVTALPVLGAAAMLLADHREAAWARLSVVRSIGLWSYSIYLWHWPIAALAYSFGYSALLWRVLGALAAVPIGAASYALVERRATNWLWQSPRRGWCAGGLSLATVAAAVFVISDPATVETWRYGSDPVVRAKLKAFRTAQSDFHEGRCAAVEHPAPLIEACRFGNPSSDDVLVIGDSYAEMIEPRYEHGFQDPSWGVAFIVWGGCLPTTGVTQMGSGADCGAWIEQALQFARVRRFKRVVFTANWPTYSQNWICLRTEPSCGSDLPPEAFEAALDKAFDRMIPLWRQLKEDGKEVIVIGLVPFPDLDLAPLALYRKIAAGDPLKNVSLSFETFDKRFQSTRQRLAHAAAAAGVTLADPHPSLCPDDACPIVRNGRLLYADDTHYRSAILGDPMFSFYDRYIGAPRRDTGGR